MFSGNFPYKPTYIPIEAMQPPFIAPSWRVPVAEAAVGDAPPLPSTTSNVRATSQWMKWDKSKEKT